MNPPGAQNQSMLKKEAGSHYYSIDAFLQSVRNIWMNCTTFVFIGRTEVGVLIPSSLRDPGEVQN